MAKSFDLKLGSRSGPTNKSMLLQNMLEGERPEYQYLQISNIQFNDKNDYSEDDSLESTRELANDIQRNGLLHNIVVSYTAEGKYKLLSGERRLRAYHLLYEETQDAKYQSIYALVRKGLSDTEEMIILDAANLQARGGMKGEKRYRKASVRFIENLKKQFNISEEEAVALTKQYAGVTDAVIEKNIAIEKELDPTIRSLLDSGDISKQQAFEYSRLNKDVQSTIGEKLSEAQNLGDKELKETNEAIFGSAKQIKNFEDSLSKKKDSLKEISDESKRETNPETKAIFSSQANSEKKKIKEIEKKIKKETENIENIAPGSSSSYYSFALSNISSFSTSLSSLFKSIFLSQLSDEEREKVKKKLEKEKERLEVYLKENF